MLETETAERRRTDEELWTLGPFIGDEGEIKKFKMVKDRSSVFL